MSATQSHPQIRIPLTQECATDNGDPVFTKRQIDNFDILLLRRLAAAANTDEISGKSTQLEIKAYFSCQYSIDDFCE